MLAGRGVLQQAGETYVPVGERGHELGRELDVPETLHALVAARLDILGDADRGLVQDASVVGKSFTVEAVSAVAGRDPADIEPRLRTLVRKEVLVQDRDLRSAERGQYRFGQSVVQEVAYSTLSRAARRAKHLACAQWVEGLEEEELAGIVATHYLEAHRAAPPRSGSGGAAGEHVSDKARQWLVRACDRALSLGSPEQALAYARQALTLAADGTGTTDPTDTTDTTDLAERAAINDRASRAAMQAGDASTGWTYLETACRDYRALGDVAAEARLVHTYRLLDDRMADLVERQRDIEARLPEDATVERVLMLAGLTYFACHSGDIEEALDDSERALALAQTLDGEQHAVREAVAARGFATMMAGRHLEARVLMESAVEMARRTGSSTAQMRALMNLGVAIAGDDPRGSLEAMLECAELAGAVGMRPTEGLALANAAESAVDVGEWDVADRALEQSGRLMALDRTDDGIDDDGVLMTRAMLAAHRGEPGAAVKDLDALESRRAAQWASVMQRTWWLRVRSLCRYLDGDDEGAAADAEASLAIDPAGGNSAGSLWMAVNAGAALRDAARIRAALEATAGLQGEWTQGVHATGRALLAGLEGDPDAAQAIRAALAAWSAADLPLDHAFARVAATYVLPEAVPAADADRARGYLESRNARALLARLATTHPPSGVKGEQVFIF
jgi:tetratricopeptide (TPR) repeat protein